MERRIDVEILRNVKLFEGLDKSLLEEAARLAIPLSMGKGARIDSQETLEHFYVVIEGLVTFRIVDPATGRAVSPLVYEEGEGFDLLALIERKEHEGEYLPAQGRVKLLQFENETFRHWIEHHPEFDENLLRAVARELMKLESFSKSVVFHDTKSRLIRLILKYAKRVKKELDRTEARWEGRFTHETLAELIGSVRTVVTTQLQALKKEGHLHEKGGSLVIEDLQRLKEAHSELLEEL